jgi:hypothetical protein
MVIYGSFESFFVVVRSTILVLSKRVVSMAVFFTQKKTEELTSNVKLYLIPKF